MSNFTEWYIDTLRDVKYYSEDHGDKLSFVQQMYSVDFENEGLPLLHLKPTPWRLAIKEMLWFISGSTDYADLHNAGCRWWQPWLQQLTDQDLLAKTIKSMPVTEIQIPYLKHAAAFTRISDRLRAGDFGSTRLYCNLWPEESVLDQAVLPPCALSYQVTVSNGRLNMFVYQRSADLICGVPANVIQYSFLLHLYAKIAKLSPGKLDFAFGDLHVYKTHLAQPEWQKLMRGSRIDSAESLSRGWYSFDLDSVSTDRTSVLDGDLVKLNAPYEHCGKVDFPVVPVHVPKHDNQM